MARLNLAYSERNEAGMRQVLEEWQNHPEAVLGDGVGQELIRTIRKIARAEARIAHLEAERSQLRASDLYALKEKVGAAKEAGRDLLGEMARRVEHQVQAASEQLQKLKSGQAQAAP
jgi:hypothetical protein